MAEFLTAFLDFIARDQASIKIIVTLAILVLGHLAVKIVKRLGTKFWIAGNDLTKKEIINRQEGLKYLGYSLDGVVIVASLLYLNAGVTRVLSTNLADFLPNLLSAGLIAILGFLTIELITRVGEDFLEKLGALTYFREVGISRSAINVLAGLFKSFLYLILLQITLTQIGIGDTFISELVHASSWAVAFLIAALLFYGFKDLFSNVAAGIYLKNSTLARPGEEVKIDGEDAEIQEISLFSTILDTRGGRKLLTPNEKIMDSNLSFRRTESDLDTLEEIQSYFVAEEDTGPAVLEMALEIFGYRTTQEDIGEELESESAENMIEAVSDLTDGETQAAFIESSKMTDTSVEFKTWFNDGAVVVPHVSRNRLFPESDGDSYILAVGVEEDEILVIDPHPEKGGVYYVDKAKMEKAMEDSEKDAGYIAVAPEGTTARWRIEKELIYADRNYYEEISKTLESRLVKIIRQGRILQTVLPEPVENYLEKWRENGEVTRLWETEEE